MESSLGKREQFTRCSAYSFFTSSSSRWRDSAVGNGYPRRQLGVLVSSRNGVNVGSESVEWFRVMDFLARGARPRALP